MRRAQAVAHRAARQLRRAIPAIAALAIAAAATGTVAQPAQAAYAPRVVIVVGPTHGSTADYLAHARRYARQARARRYVETVFHPHATWKRVMAAAQGANVFIYLGHGNGWPSPYAPYQGNTKNGLGLNPYDGASKNKVKFYGEDWIRPTSASPPRRWSCSTGCATPPGTARRGSPSPSWRTAVKRVDNYAERVHRRWRGGRARRRRTPRWATRSPGCSAQPRHPGRVEVRPRCQRPRARLRLEALAGLHRPARSRPREQRVLPLAGDPRRHADELRSGPPPCGGPPKCRPDPPRAGRAPTPGSSPGLRDGVAVRRPRRAGPRRPRAELGTGDDPRRQAGVRSRVGDELRGAAVTRTRRQPPGEPLRLAKASGPVGERLPGAGSWAARRDR